MIVKLWSLFTVGVILSRGVCGTQSHSTDHRRFPRQILEIQNATQKIETTSVFTTSMPKISTTQKFPTTTTLPASTTFPSRAPTTEPAKTTKLSKTEGTTSVPSTTEIVKTTKLSKTEGTTSISSTPRVSTTEIVRTVNSTVDINVFTVTPKPKVIESTTILRNEDEKRVEEELENLQAMESQIISNYTENTTLKIKKPEETTTVIASTESSSNKPAENKIKTEIKGSSNSLFTTSKALTPTTSTIGEVERTTSLFSRSTTMRSHVQKIPVAPVSVTTELPFSRFYNSSMKLEDFSYLLYPQNSSIPCALASAQIHLDVPDNSDSNKTTFGGFFGQQTKRFQVPKNAHVSGSCDPNDSHMILTWAEEKSNKSLENSVIFHFAKDSENFYISDVNINVYVDKKDMATGNAAVKLFSASLTDGVYVCSEPTRISCGNIDLTMENVRLIAYNADPQISSRRELVCAKNYYSVSSKAVWVSGAVIIGCFISVTIFYCRRRVIRTQSELP